jgi:hypothetical protein
LRLRLRNTGFYSEFKVMILTNDFTYSKPTVWLVLNCTARKTYEYTSI